MEKGPVDLFLSNRPTEAGDGALRSCGPRLAPTEHKQEMGFDMEKGPEIGRAHV